MLLTSAFAFALAGCCAAAALMSRSARTVEDIAIELCKVVLYFGVI